MNQKNKMPAGEVLLSYRSVWKLYAARADEVAAKHGQKITDNIIVGNGLIPAARDGGFDVRKGEIFVITGLSGSGKSTILHCMTGLSEPTMGQLRVSG